MGKFFFLGIVNLLLGIAALFVSLFITHGILGKILGPLAIILGVYLLKQK
jgi:hypothetical protein